MFVLLARTDYQSPIFWQVYNCHSIREAAVKAAETKAEEVAKRIAEPVATRAAEAAVRATAPEDRTDDLAKALSEGDGQ